MQENQISHTFWTFLLLSEEGMASCCVTFRESKSAEEGRNLIENAILKSTCEVTKWWVKIFLEWQNGWKNKNPAIEPCPFTTDKSKVQRLDTDIANMTAESQNFCLIKFVLLILCKSKFTVCEITWNNVKYSPTICCQVRVDN